MSIVILIVIGFFSDFVIWDYELDISQSTIISDIFIQHIAGTTNALNNDLQPVDMHSLYNNYNFDNNYCYY